MSNRSFKFVLFVTAALPFAGCAPVDGSPAESVQAIEEGPLVASPASLDLGRVAVGSVAEGSLRLTNRGADDITIIGGLPPGPCRISTSAIHLRAGETASLAVACAPTEVGEFGGDATLTYDAGRATGLALRVGVAGVAYRAR